MTQIAVTKMHGTRNDFVVVDERNPKISDYSAFARRACDRRSGIGADGVLAILRSGAADARMRVINADGGEAEMCGNGVRCVARYLSEAGSPDRLRIETLAGIIETQIVSKGLQYAVRVNMGVPDVQARSLPFADSAFVSMGNPHVVIFAAALDDVNLHDAARRLADDPSFAAGTNVHAAVRVNDRRLDVRHYERGVGLTQACGTGAVACAAAAIARGQAVAPVDVRVPGGSLEVEWIGAGPSFLTGPAVRVFDARVPA
ncbi:MAG: diaminopimelate epimerase [Candidatus Eremiobacteraeota bacterium]|nr:diaminopimelate epimerase [Candidatus Eremiobacteraeota bacterium]